MPTQEQINAASDMVGFFRAGGVQAVTISSEEWKAGTSLGILKPRSSDLRAIDDALHAYHSAGKSLDAFIPLKRALENWQRSKGNWTASERNRSGIVQQLHNQVTLVDAGRFVQQMGNSEDWEARKELLAAEKEAISRLFSGRTLEFRDAKKLSLSSERLTPRHVVTDVKSTAMDVRGAISPFAQTSVGVTPQTVKDTCSTILGAVSPEVVFQGLGMSFFAFCSSAASVLSMAKAPAQLLYDLGRIGQTTALRVRGSKERFSFRAGDADSALNALNRMLERELALLAKDASQQVGTIVAAAFSAGPIATAANSVVDLIVNIALYAQMRTEIDEGNRLLANGRYTVDLFDASPVLGCYFLVLADTSVWLNWSVHDMGTPGWMDAVEKLRKGAQPLRKKARKIIRESKYVLSGTKGLNGLEWEPSWRNDKVAYVQEQISNKIDYVKGEIREGLGTRVDNLTDTAQAIGDVYDILG